MKRNIMLVDDDPIFNLLTSKALERIGFTNDFQTASNGEQALRLINSYYSGTHSLPDVIFLDLNMPIMDGFGFVEAFQRLKTPRRKKTKIVILTSSTDPGDIQRAKELGIEHYLTKPVTEHSLRTVMAPDMAAPT